MGRHSAYLRKFRHFGLSFLGFLLAIAMTLGPGSLSAPAVVDVPSSGMSETIASENLVLPDNKPSDDKLTAARAHYAAGRFAEAIELWQSAVQEATQQGDLARQVMSFNGLSVTYQALNDWDHAHQAVERSRALLEDASQAESILWAQTLNTQAELLLDQGGQAETALATWEQAEAYYAQAGDAAGVLGCQINQAQALQSLGFYRRARQQLATINQQLATLPDSEIKVAGLRSLGKSLQLIGDPRDSYDVLAESLAVAKRLNATSEISSILLSIGKLAAEVESQETALAYFQSAETAALTPLDQLQARLDQLVIYVDTQNLEPITVVVDKIQQQLKTLPPSRTTIYGTVNFAHHISRLPHAQRPLSEVGLNQLLADAVKAAKDLKDQRAEAYALLQMGQLYGQTQQWSEALTLTQQSLNLAEATQSVDVISQSAWQLGQLFKRQQQRQPAIAAYTKAVVALKALRGDLVAINQDIQFSFREQVEPVYRELVALLLEEKTQTSLSQARDVLEALQLAELDNFFREACLDLQANQIDQIDPNATVVYSIILPDRIAAIYSKTGQPLQAYETPVAQATLETTLRSFLTSLHPSKDRRERLWYAQQLYNWLIRPAEEAQVLTPDQTLVFVLDGALRNIPMAALYDGEQYLIEKYAVALSPGLQLMSAKSLNRQNIHALVGGISESRGRFSALPAVEGEVKTISQLVSSSELLNQDFTRESLTNSLANSQIDVVHLATHGQFSSEFNNTFFLTWDGVININELAEILQSRETGQNSAIELLTLSACETATGDERAALGLAGLAVRSGARSTLATLWPIKDEVAKRLMITFYNHLSQSQMGKAEALRQAQLDLLHSGDFADPFFWSAYVLIGNWL